MFGRELRLSELLRYNPSPDQNESTLDYVIGMKHIRKQAYEILQDQQAHIKENIDDEPLKFSEGNLVLLENRRENKTIVSNYNHPSLDYTGY